MSPSRPTTTRVAELPGEAVSDPRHRMYVGRLLCVRLDLAPQPVHMSIDGARLDLDLVPPHPTEQFSAAHHLTGPRREQGEQVELGEREHHLLTIAEHLTAPQIDGESGKLEAVARLLLRGDLTATQVCSDARHQL